MNLKVGDIVVWKRRDSGRVGNGEFRCVEIGTLGIVIETERLINVYHDSAVTVLLSDGRPFRTPFYIDNIDVYLEVL